MEMGWGRCLEESHKTWVRKGRRAEEECGLGGGLWT